MRQTISRKLNEFARILKIRPRTMKNNWNKTPKPERHTKMQSLIRAVDIAESKMARGEFEAP